MAERISFHRLAQNKDSLWPGRSVEAYLDSKTPIFDGASTKYETRLVLSYRIHPERSHIHGAYVVRRYLPDNIQIDESVFRFFHVKALNDLDRAQRAKAAGLPLPDVMRYFVDEDGSPALLISDVSCGKTVPTWSMFHDKDPAVFKAVMKNDSLEIVRMQLDSIGQKASRAGLWVTEHGFLLRRTKESGIEVMVTDLDDGLFDVKETSAPVLNAAASSNYFDYLCSVSLQD